MILVDIKKSEKNYTKSILIIVKNEIVIQN